MFVCVGLTIRSPNTSPVTAAKLSANVHNRRNNNPPQIHPSRRRLTVRKCPPTSERPPAPAFPNKKDRPSGLFHLLTPSPHPRIPPARSHTPHPRMPKTQPPPPPPPPRRAALRQSRLQARLAPQAGYDRS